MAVNDTITELLGSGAVALFSPDGVVVNARLNEVDTPIAMEAAMTVAIAAASVAEGAVHKTASGAITIAPSIVGLGSGGVLAMTLAAPSSPAQDGTRMFIVAETAHAHTVTTPANTIKGANTSGDTVTFAHVGDSVELEALGGLWYVRGGLSGAVLSEV